MTDLVEFLRAALDEDERVARMAMGGSKGRWTMDFDRDMGVVFDDRQDVIVLDEDDPIENQLSHIARHDPARVLAEVAAKRAIVELHSPTNEEEHGSPQGFLGGGRYGYIEPACITCGTFDEYAVPWPCDTIKALAQPYAGRPGWREEWAT
jgi:hypothetical protein